MTQLRKYMVYLEDKDNVYKIAVPAQDADDAIRWTAGNGDLVSVKDVTDEFEYRIDADQVFNALDAYGFNRKKIDFILRTLDRTGITD